MGSTELRLHRRALACAVGAFLAEYPADGFLVGLIFYGWSVLPFFTVAVIAQGLKIGWLVFFAAAVLVTAVTVFMQVEVLLHASGSTDGVAFVFVPIWLSLAVGLLAASELAIRTALSKLRRG